MTAEDFRQEVQRIIKKNTKGVYRISIAYIDSNLEFQTFETDGADLRNVLTKLSTMSNIQFP